MGILIDDSDKFTLETITKAAEKLREAGVKPPFEVIPPGEGTKPPEAQPSPWESLNKARGIKPGELVVIAGRSEQGKTWIRAKQEAELRARLEARGGKTT